MVIPDAVVARIADFSKTVGAETSVVNAVGSGAIVGLIEGLVISLGLKIEKDPHHFIALFVTALCLYLDIRIASNIDVSWLLGAILGILGGVAITLPKKTKKTL